MLTNPIEETDSLTNPRARLGVLENKATQKWGVHTELALDLRSVPDGTGSYRYASKSCPRRFTAIFCTMISSVPSYIRQTLVSTRCLGARVSKLYPLEPNI